MASWNTADGAQGGQLHACCGIDPSILVLSEGLCGPKDDNPWPSTVAQLKSAFSAVFIGLCRPNPAPTLASRRRLRGGQAQPGRRSRGLACAPAVLKVSDGHATELPVQRRQAAGLHLVRRHSLHCARPLVLPTQPVR